MVRGWGRGGEREQGWGGASILLCEPGFLEVPATFQESRALISEKYLLDLASILT